MKKLSASLTVLLLSISLQAQTAWFSATLGTVVVPSGLTGFGSVRLPSGEFITVHHVGTNLVITQLDLSGAITSVQNVLLSESIDNVASLQLTSDNRLIVTGRLAWSSKYYVASIDRATGLSRLITRPVASVAYASGPDVSIQPDGYYITFPDYQWTVVHKVDNDLNRIWADMFYTTLYGTGKHPCLDGSFIGGSFYFTTKDDYSFSIGKMSPAGNFEDYINYTGGASYTRIYNITELADSNLLFSGLIYSGGVEVPVLMKLSPSGDVIWSKTIVTVAGPGYKRLVNAIELPDGRIAAFATHTSTYAHAYYDGIIMFDQDGGLLSEMSLGDDSHVYKLEGVKLFDDGLLLSGDVISTSGVHDRILIFTEYNLDHICYSSQGSYASVDHNPGTPNHVSSVLFSHFPEPPISSTVLPSLVASYAPAPDFCSTVTAAGKPVENSIHVYPNPVSSDEEISITGLTGSGVVNMIDIHGREAHSITINGGHATISTADLSPGIYLLLITLENAVIHRKKIVVH